MHRNVSATVSAPAKQIFEIVSDLSTYSEWLGLVAAVVEAEEAPGDIGPAWIVTIRAKVGPFARSKKLRMVRTVHDAGQSSATARFERRELDGRDHSAWTLQSVIMEKADQRTAVQMDLRYDGGLWTAPLEPILGAFIDDAGERLDSYASR